MNKKTLLLTLLTSAAILTGSVFAQDFGEVSPPPGLDLGSGGVEDIPILVTILLRTLIVIAGVYSVINFILAGFAYISAGGDSKRIQDATAKIWQTVLGLVVAAGAFVIAGVIGSILFGDPGALLDIKIFVPN